MGRKRGGKNADTDLKVQQALEKVVKDGKSQQEVAKELGVDKSTISLRVRKALQADEIQATIARSRNRLIKMLSRCDQAYVDALECAELENFTNRIKVATSIYRTFGLIDDEAQVKNINIIPIQVNVKGPDGEHSYTAGERANRSSPETGSGV